MASARSVSLCRCMGAGPLAASSGTAHGQGSGSLGSKTLEAKSLISSFGCSKEKHIRNFEILLTQKIDKACV